VTITFASMAEARAHFYELGYETVEDESGGDYYLLAQPHTGVRVELIKKGLLSVDATRMED